MNHPYHRKGFSVWDALAIAVIVLFIVMMFPVMSPPHECARKSICQNNIKELAVAIDLYWDDYNGYLPSSALVNHSKKWNRADFLEFTRYTGTLPPKARPRTYTQAVYKYMKHKDIMFCPSDEYDHDVQNPPCTYWWKLAIDKAWYNGAKKEVDFAYPADQIILYERLGWHFGDTKGLANGVQINVAYLDTHVRTIALKNCKPGYTNTPAPTSGEPAYFNCKFPVNGDPTKKLLDNIPANYTDPSTCGDAF